MSVQESEVPLNGRLRCADCPQYDEVTPLAETSIVEIMRSEVLS